MSASPKTDTDPAAWRSGFLSLRPTVVPCPGFTMASWGAIHEKCITFLDTRADEAAALGWDTLLLFGVHPQIGTGRVDFCGAMVIGPEPVTGMAADRISFARTTFYRNKPGRPTGAVPLWAFRG